MFCVLTNTLISASPLDIWHDSLVQVIIGAVVALVLTIVSIVVAIWIHLKGRDQKEISYSVLTDNPVLRVGEEVKSKIKIEFDGQKVAGMSLVVLKVWNTGNRSVKPQDYLEPMIFKFEGRKVLDVSIQRMEPQHLMKSEDIKKYLEDNKPLPQNEKDTLQLPLIHLNSQKRTHKQESLTLKVLLSGSDGTISVEGKIDDGDIKEFNQDYHLIPNVVGILILLIVIIGGIIGFLLIAPQHIQQQLTLVQLIIGILIVFIFVRMVWGLITPFRCQCGYITWSAIKMLNHVEKKH